MNPQKEMKKLPKKFKKKWIEALRSGDFKQGTSCLKYEDVNGNTRYCCLGVACEISGAKVITSQSPGFIDGYKSVRGMNKVPKMLHGDLGIPEKLANMNDSANPRKTFRGIATWIEKNL